MANPARAYLATQVETTTQGELLIMLYEAAIKFLKRAKIEIDNKDFAKKGIYISKAMAIIHELSESLNKEKGGAITPKLSQLYMFCTSQLVKANIRLDNKMIDEVINILDGIRSAYAQIVPVCEGKAAPGDSQSIPTKQPAPEAPQPVSPQVAPAPQPTAYAAPKLSPAPQQPAQPAALQQTTAPEQKTEAQPVTQSIDPSKQATKPKPQQPTPPPKLRTGFNAAKFRAANAYTTNNS